jgi:uncharacterized protein
VSTKELRGDRPQSPSPLVDGIFQARRPTGPLLALVVVLVCLVLGQTAGTIAFAFVLGISPASIVDGTLGLREQLALMGSFLGSTLMLAAWMRWKERRSFASVGFFPASRIGQHLLLGAAAAVVLMTVPVLLNLLFGQFELASGGFRIARIGGVLLALVGFVVQGSTEEILMRGYLMQTTYRRWGLAVAIVLQALVFMALHGINGGLSVIAMINLVLISLLFAFWALAEGSLWGVCAFHSIWNWCQGNVYGIQVSGLDVRTALFDVRDVEGGTTVITGGGFGIEGSLITTVLLAIGTVVAALAFRRRLASA